MFGKMYLILIQYITQRRIAPNGGDKRAKRRHAVDMAPMLRFERALERVQAAQEALAPAA